MPYNTLESVDLPLPISHSSLDVLVYHTNKNALNIPNGGISTRWKENMTTHSELLLTPFLSIQLLFERVSTPLAHLSPQYEFHGSLCINE